MIKEVVVDGYIGLNELSGGDGGGIDVWDVAVR
jgi:hypothetical protein